MACFIFLKNPIKHGLSCSPLLYTNASPLLVLHAVAGDCREMGLALILLGERFWLEILPETSLSGPEPFQGNLNRYGESCLQITDMQIGCHASQMNLGKHVISLWAEGDKQCCAASRWTLTVEEKVGGAYSHVSKSFKCLLDCCSQERLDLLQAVPQRQE